MLRLQLGDLTWRQDRTIQHHENRVVLHSPTNLIVDTLTGLLAAVLGVSRGVLVDVSEAAALLTGLQQEEAGLGHLLMAEVVALCDRHAQRRSLRLDELLLRILDHIAPIVFVGSLGLWLRIVAKNQLDPRVSL